jgi:hypothetical protein
MFLGELVDPATNQRTGSKVELDASSLTTHGVIVGQTGSGKTGLGIVAIEEALSEGVPCLLIDPKGDLGNLLLTFPGQSAEEFAPWVEGDDPAAVAAQWKEGLASFGIDSARISALRAKASFTIYTPGSDAGVGLNLIGSLRAPMGAADDPEGRLDEIGSIVSGLLSLVGVESDPLAGREHILLTNLLDKAWSTGSDLDLATLIAQIQTPPMRKLGVLELDTFYPAKERMELALKLNGLAASPAFAAWGEGEDLDIDTLLFNGDKPRCAIISISHLSDEERQFAVAVLLGRLITWMRKQPGTAKLRAMVYFDEVFGFVPPTAMPPTKKPILTLLKQARAFGVGMVLATQNPVDVDYKALANATTWMVGRLQTERDKDRLLDGMRSAAGGVDIDALGATISGLAKRSFVLHRAGQAKPSVFTTRWTMSYLRGPLTREQIRTLMGSPSAAATANTAKESVAVPAGISVLADNEVPVPPPVAKGTSTYFLHPATPWAAQVGASATSKRYEPYLAARVNLLFDEDDAGLREADEWEAVFPLAGSFTPDSAIVVDYDARDYLSEPPTGATFVLPKVSIGEPALFTGVSKMITDYLLVNKTMELQHNEALKLWSRTAETTEDFLTRCDVASQAKADAEAAKLRASLESKIDRVQTAMDEAERKKELAEHEAKSSRTTEFLTGAGELLGALLGGRRNARSIARSVGSAVNRRGRASDKAAKADTAEDRLNAKVDELTALESQLHDELFAIDSKWDEVGRSIVKVQIPLEKTDIRVVELAVVWVPK